MIRRFAVLLSVLLLGACAAPVRNEDAAHYRVPRHSLITLNQPLTVPEGQTRVFLQHGKVVAKGKLDQYRSHCDFEVRGVSDGSQVIEPDTFDVTRVSVGDDFVVSREPVVYAALVIFNDANQPSQISPYVHHWLSSTKQPQVMRLTCHGGFDYPGIAEYPSIKQIKQALGAVATLSLATAP